MPGPSYDKRKKKGRRLGSASKPKRTVDRSQSPDTYLQNKGKNAQKKITKQVKKARKQAPRRGEGSTRQTYEYRKYRKPKPSAFDRALKTADDALKSAGEHFGGGLQEGIEKVKQVKKDIEKSVNIGPVEKAAEGIEEIDKRTGGIGFIPEAGLGKSVGKLISKAGKSSAKSVAKSAPKRTISKAKTAAPKKSSQATADATLRESVDKYGRLAGKSKTKRKLAKLRPAITTKQGPYNKFQRAATGASVAGATGGAVAAPIVGGYLKTTAEADPKKALKTTINSAPAMIGAAVGDVAQLGKGVGEVLNPLDPLDFQTGSKDISAATTRIAKDSVNWWKIQAVIARGGSEPIEIGKDEGGNPILRTPKQLVEEDVGYTGLLTGALTTGFILKGASGLTGRGKPSRTGVKTSTLAKAKQNRLVKAAAKGNPEAMKKLEDSGAGPIQGRKEAQLTAAIADQGGLHGQNLVNTALDTKAGRKSLVKLIRKADRIKAATVAIPDDRGGTRSLTFTEADLVPTLLKYPLPADPASARLAVRQILDSMAEGREGRGAAEVIDQKSTYNALRAILANPEVVQRPRIQQMLFAARTAAENFATEERGPMQEGRRGMTESDAVAARVPAARGVGAALQDERLPVELRPLMKEYQPKAYESAKSRVRASAQRDKRLAGTARKQVKVAERKAKAARRRADKAKTDKGAARARKDAENFDSRAEALGRKADSLETARAQKRAVIGRVGRAIRLEEKAAAIRDKRATGENALLDPVLLEAEAQNLRLAHEASSAQLRKEFIKDVDQRLNAKNYSAAPVYVKGRRVDKAPDFGPRMARGRKERRTEGVLAGQGVETSSTTSFLEGLVEQRAVHSRHLATRHFADTFFAKEGARSGKSKILSEEAQTAAIYRKEAVAQLEKRGVPIEKDGTVLLYHQTTTKNAAKIKKDGFRGDSDGQVFFSTLRNDTSAGGSGISFPVRVSVERLRGDSFFRDRAWFQVDLREGQPHLRPQKLGDRPRIFQNRDDFNQALLNEPDLRGYSLMRIRDVGSAWQAGDWADGLGNINSPFHRAIRDGRVRPGEGYFAVRTAAMREWEKQMLPLSGGWNVLRSVGRVQSLALLATSPMWFFNQLFASPAAMLARNPNIARWPKAIKQSIVDYRRMSKSQRDIYDAMIGGTTGHIFENLDRLPHISDNPGVLGDIAHAQATAKKTWGGRFLHSVRTGGPLIAGNRKYEAWIRRIDSILEMDKMVAEERRPEMHAFARTVSELDDTTAAHIAQMEKTPLADRAKFYTDNSIARNELNRRIDDALGNWSALTRVEKSAATALIFYPFLRFSLRWMTYAYPKNNPMKAVVLLNAAAINAMEIEMQSGGEDLGGMWQYGNVKVGENTTVNMSRFLPGSNAVIESMGGDRGALQTALAPFQPIIGATASALAGQDPFTGAPLPYGVQTAQAIGKSLLDLPAPLRSFIDANEDKSAVSATFDAMKDNELFSNDSLGGRFGNELVNNPFQTTGRLGAQQELSRFLNQSKSSDEGGKRPGDGEIQRFLDDWSTAYKAALDDGNSTSEARKIAREKTDANKTIKSMRRRWDQAEIAQKKISAITEAFGQEAPKDVDRVLRNKWSEVNRRVKNEGIVHFPRRKAGRRDRAVAAGKLPRSTLPESEQGSKWDKYTGLDDEDKWDKYTTAGSKSKWDQYTP